MILIRLLFLFQVCANGLVKFNNPSYALNPRNFGTYSGQNQGSESLAPYWSLVDLKFFQTGFSKVYYRSYENRMNNFQVFERIESAAKEILNTTEYTASWVAVVTWENLKPKQPLNNTYGGVS